jgi:predicted O-methyltransferase YrrM
MNKNSEKPTTPRLLVEEILKTNQVKNSEGQSIPLRGNIDIAEGKFLEKIVSENPNVTNTLEIGCAFGVSSIFICMGLDDKEQPKHTILDPFQHQNYAGIGLLNLRRAGFDFVNLIEEYSEFALPSLLKKQENSFDLIFIDGLHTFDQVMLDFYYANRLIKTGGFIVFDDCGFRSISSALTYILKYPAYTLFDQVTTTSTLKKIIQGIIHLIPRAVSDAIFPNFLKTEINRLRFNSMVAIQKVAEDNRNNRWFTNF